MLEYLLLIQEDTLLSLLIKKQVKKIDSFKTEVTMFKTILIVSSNTESKKAFFTYTEKKS